MTSLAKRPRADRAESLIVAIISVAVILRMSRSDSTIYNNYVLLADAFLHGHVWILWPGEYIDALPFNGNHFVIEAPLPAILLMPFVAIFHFHTNQTAFACVMAGLSVGVAWHVARQLGASTQMALALIAFFALGTDTAWCAIYGGVWHAAHSTAVLFAMLAVAEFLGKGRLWILALWIVAASGARFGIIVALPALLVPCIARVESSRRLAALIPAFVVLGLAAILFVSYNEARWNLPYDIGYTEWYHQDQIGEPTGSPFRLAYLPYELYSFFLTVPKIIHVYPWVVPSYGAVAIEVTSPALALSCFVGRSLRGSTALAIAALFVAIPSFVYYANGGSQFGMRHALDFIPFLFPLVARGGMRVYPAVSFCLLYGSAVIGCWGLWFWRTFYDSMLVHTLPPGYPH